MSAIAEFLGYCAGLMLLGFSASFGLYFGARAAAELWPVRINTNNRVVHEYRTKEARHD